MGVAHSEWLTFSSTPSFSSRSNSAPTIGLRANGNLHGLQYFGCTSSFKISFAVVAVQQPRPGLNECQECLVNICLVHSLMTQFQTAGGQSLC